MRPLMIASLTALPLLALAASNARAQEAEGPPGMCNCAVPAPAVAAPMIMPELPRWSVGLSLVSIGVRPADSPDADPTNFGGGGIEAYYRIWPHWDLGLQLQAGREQLASGDQGDRELRLSTLSARYHLSPYARWDFYLVGGLGSAAVVPADFKGKVPDDANRAAGTFGAGVTRHFGHLGLSAELRLVSIAGDTTSADAPPMATTAGTTSTPTPAPTASSTDPGSAGGAFSLTASYSF